MNRLRYAAVAALVLHLLAGASLAFILRHGLETNPDLQSRLAFVVNNRALWMVGWLTWTAAAIAFLFFNVAFAAVHQGKGPPRVSLRFAVLLTGAAIAPDLSAQAIEIGVLPGITDRPDLFIILHRVVVLLSGYLANGLYSLSLLILGLSARRVYAKWVWCPGVAAAIFGFMLSAAALVDSAAGMFWTNVLLVPSLLVWFAGVAVEKPVDFRPVPLRVQGVQKNPEKK